MFRVVASPSDMLIAVRLIYRVFGTRIALVKEGKRLRILVLLEPKILRLQKLLLVSACVKFLCSYKSKHYCANVLCAKGTNNIKTLPRVQNMIYLSTFS